MSFILNRTKDRCGFIYSGMTPRHTFHWLKILTFANQRCSFGFSDSAFGAVSKIKGKGAPQRKEETKGQGVQGIVRCGVEIQLALSYFTKLSEVISIELPSCNSEGCLLSYQIISGIYKRLF